MLSLPIVCFVSSEDLQTGDFVVVLYDSVKTVEEALLTLTSSHQQK